jgi:DNA-binding MarR family transcriptional regulator
MMVEMTEQSEPRAAASADWGRRLSTAVVMFHEALGNVLGLTAVDHRALHLIMRNAPLSASSLAQLTGLTPGAVTGMIDRLERAGYVRRGPDPDDRRRILITPLFDQHNRLAEVYGSLGAAMSGFMAKYDERELAVIADYVQHTIDVLEAETRRISGS